MTTHHTTTCTINKRTFNAVVTALREKLQQHKAPVDINEEFSRDFPTDVNAPPASKATKMPVREEMKKRLVFSRRQNQKAEAR